MRTTVTLDDDTEQIVRERMANKGSSFKKALNDAIREGRGTRPSVEPFVMAPRSLGRARTDLTKALQLAGELEDEHQLAVLRGAG
ncbi:MAG: hypothetical protein ACR2K3_12810 [Nocardioides sp.]